jgi:hypothetical protein
MFCPSEIRLCGLLLPCYLFFLRLEYIEYNTYIHTHTLYIKRLAIFLVPLVPNLTSPYFTKAKRVTKAIKGGYFVTN